jgi:hypothetical protein
MTNAVVCVAPGPTATTDTEGRRVIVAKNGVSCPATDNNSIVRGTQMAVARALCDTLPPGFSNVFNSPMRGQMKFIVPILKSDDTQTSSRKFVGTQNRLLDSKRGAKACKNNPVENQSHDERMEKPDAWPNILSRSHGYLEEVDNMFATPILGGHVRQGSEIMLQDANELFDPGIDTDMHADWVAVANHTDRLMIPDATANGTEGINKVSAVDNVNFGQTTKPSLMFGSVEIRPSSPEHKVVTEEDRLISDFVMKWIVDNEVDQQIADMGMLADGGRRQPSEICWGDKKVSALEIEEWDAIARGIIEEPLVSGVYSDDDLDMSLVTRDSEAVRANGLSHTLARRIDGIKYRGLNREQLVDSLSGYPLSDNLLDLIDHGQRAFMKPTFKPNGGERFKQSKSYYEYSALCNRHLFKLQAEGDAIIVESSAITPEEKAECHYSSVVLAASSNPNREGRCCINLGYSAQGPRNDRHKRLMSFNEGYDCDESDAWYPPTKLPDIRDICELACVKRARFEGVEPLSSATMDVYKAYRQVVADLETSKLTSIIIEVNGKSYMVYTHVGFFGHTRTGHAYNVLGGFIDYKHNLEYTLKHKDRPGEKASVTYIDDTIVIDSESSMQEDRGSLKRIIKGLHGKEAVKPAKDILHGLDLQAIGWQFNLRYDIWRVSPKPRAIGKIYAAVFHLLPKNFCDENTEVKVTRRLLLSIASLLSWYSVGLKLGNSFVHSLYKSAGWGCMDALKVVSLNCKRDVGWWRILSVASMRNPWFLSTDISSLRRNMVPTVFICGDACTGIGGGGWLGSSADEASAGREAFIRWSPAELKAFEDYKLKNDGKPVDINVLEYFTIVYLVMLWGPQLRGKCIHIQCDNTSAVAWLQKMRASNKSPIGETLVQIFCLYCISMDITLVCVHLRGILNVKSDTLSRSLLLKLIQEDSGVIEALVDLKDESWWTGQSRTAICRNLLLASITMPWTVPSQTTLSLLKALL